MFKNVLVGVGADEAGRDAIALASRLVSARGQLTLLHVYVVTGKPAPDSGAAGAAKRRYARERLAALADEFHPAPSPPLPRKLDRTEADVPPMLQALRDLIAPGAHIAIEVDHSVPRALARLVTREHPDLLVLGSNRRAPQGRVRIGGRTRQLLGDAQCAMAVAPRGLSTRGRPRVAVIGVGYDGKPEAREALSQAGGLAHAAGARLRVRAVVDNRLPAFGWTPTDGPDLEEIGDEIIEPQAESLLEDAEREASATGAEVAVEVRVGSPMEEMIAFSRELDLLAVGSRRWGKAKGVLLGTTGEGLMRDAYCPVMVVPRSAPPDATRSDASATELS